MKNKYTDEQKHNAVRMLIEEGPHKARDVLGIPTNTLYRWKKQMLGILPADDIQDCEEECNPETEAPDVERIEDECQGEHEEQPRKPATVPEIEAVISRYFMESLENRPEIFVDSIIMAVKNIFKENAALARENEKLRKTLRLMLEE